MIKRDRESSTEEQHGDKPDKINPIIPIGMLISAIYGIPAEQKLASERYRYLMAEQQRTLIPATESDDPDKKYGPALSDFGMKTLCDILLRVKDGDFDKILSKYYIACVHSGPRTPDQNSQYYDPEEMISFNTFENKIIRGYSDNNYINSGYIIFYTKQWAWSSDGTLYKLEKQCSVENFTAKSQESPRPRSGGMN